MKNAQLVSDIVNDLRALSIDDRISERYVLSTLRSANATFLKRENDQLRLHTYDIWTPIDCLEMIESDHAECSGIKKIFKYMRSKERIPELYSYSNGSLIKEVLSLDDYSPYEPTTLRTFKDIQNREFKSKKKYCWIRDGYLIIPDGPQTVSFLGCFIDSSLARSISMSNCEDCRNPMDEEFPCPPHLVDTVKKEVLDRLVKVYKRMIRDEVADLDTNVKTEKKN